MSPPSNLRAVLFDWDGTLLDSYQADSQAYLSMFRDLGVSWGLTELDAHYTPDWYRVYRAAGIAEARWGKADALWRGHYLKHRSRLMPGARRVVTQLGRKYRLGLVTSGDRTRVMRQLREFGLTRAFRVRVCGDDATVKKPDPAPLRMALKKMKLAPSDCVYVGDTAEDLLMARAAGVLSISVRGPFPTGDKLLAAKPEYFLESLAELPGLLRRLYGKAAAAGV